MHKNHFIFTFLNEDEQKVITYAANIIGDNSKLEQLLQHSSYNEMIALNESIYGIHDVIFENDFIAGFSSNEIPEEVQECCFNDIMQFFNDNGFHISRLIIHCGDYDTDSCETNEYLLKNL